MANSIMEDILDMLSSDIRNHFSTLRINITVKRYPYTPELWVYVFDQSKLKEVEQYCDELARRPTDPSITVTILTKPWTERPVGETVDDYRRKRDEFLKRHSRTSAP